MSFIILTALAADGGGPIVGASASKRVGVVTSNILTAEPRNEREGPGTKIVLSKGAAMVTFHVAESLEEIAQAARLAGAAPLEVLEAYVDMVGEAVKR